jgi:hypothetical protein
VKRIAFVLAFLIAGIYAALAQPVTVIGPITPGDFAIFNSTTVIKDGGNAGTIFTGLSGDCTATSLGVITCTKTNGVSFGPFATQAAPCTIAQGCTGQTTATLSFGALAPSPTRAGDIIYWNGSAWVTLAGNNSGTQVLSENGSGVPAWSPAGAATVTSVAPGNGLVTSTTSACSQTAITVSGTLSAAECVNAQTGTSYAIADVDRAKLITANNTAAQAYTIAQAGASTTFQAGWLTDIQNINSTSNPAGIVTLTATTSIFSATGTTTLKIYPGQGVRIISDGTNYQVIPYNLATGGLVLLNTLIASASASLSDTTSMTAAFSSYKFIFENIVPASAANILEAQVQVGGSFVVASYLGSSVNTVAGAAGAFACGGLTTALCVSDNNGTVSTNAMGVNAECLMITPSNTTSDKAWQCDFTYLTATPAMSRGISGGTYNGGTGAVTGIKFLFNSGNITSGTIKIYGIQ